MWMEDRGSGRVLLDTNCTGVLLPEPRYHSQMSLPEQGTAPLSHGTAP